MGRVLAVLVLALSTAALGCSFSVPPVEPRPNVAMPDRAPSFALSISEAIPDEFDVEPKNGVKGGSVAGWRVSLQRGFDNGFARGSGKTVAHLELEMADLEYVMVSAGTPAVYVPTGTVTGVVVPGASGSAQALVTFRGRWRVEGREIPFADVARSKGTAGDVFTFDDLAESAIETMYEMAGKELFAALERAPAPAGAPAEETPPTAPAEETPAAAPAEETSPAAATSP